MTGPAIPRRAIVIFSGGPDSTAAALWAVSEGIHVELLTFQFKNQEQYHELRAAINVATTLGLSHTILDFKSPLHLFPEGVRILMHAGADSEATTREGKYLLPFGAGIVLSMAASYALSRNISQLVWGATKSDGYENFEYSQGFAEELGSLISKAVGSTFSIHVPWAARQKYEVLSQFQGQESLFAATWSCRSPKQGRQCGECEACIARRLSAQLAGLADRSAYSTPAFKHPLSAQQLGDPRSISDEVLAALTKSPK
jgi:7-cyano-7-deazaguanine synthase